MANCHTFQELDKVMKCLRFLHDKGVFLDNPFLVLSLGVIAKIHFHRIDYEKKQQN